MLRFQARVVKLNTFLEMREFSMILSRTYILKQLSFFKRKVSSSKGRETSQKNIGQEYIKKDIKASCGQKKNEEIHQNRNINK